MDKITLNGEVVIQLTNIHQYLTYDGLIEGLPTREMNDKLIVDLCTQYPGAHLLTPAQTPIGQAEPYPFGEPASLPDVTCVATFRGPGATESVIDFTQLTILWFQQEWAMPIDARIAEQVRALPWFGLAQELEV